VVLKTLDEFLAEHAISEEIGGHGRYVRFEKGEIDFVASHYEGFDAETKRLAKVVAGQLGGFVIVRQGFGSKVPPQLRPDEAVYTSNLRKPSYHPSRPNAWPIKHKKTTVWPLRGKQLERHLAKWHDGMNVEGLHFHRRAAKYVLPPGAHGKRLDVPLPDRVRDAERVFFVIEGSLKTDAILSKGEAAFGVPSVTLWDAPELDDFLRVMNLRAKEVVIVPDADWVTNALVVMQAIMCRTYLRERGVHAIVAAPPLSARAVIQDPVFGPLKGVDDFLRAGYPLNEMEVLEREPCDYPTAYRALKDSSRYWNAVHRNLEALSRLSLHATGSGELIYSIKAFAKIMGSRSRNPARKAIVDLYEAGVVDVVKGSLDADFQYEGHDYDWDDPPTVTIKPEFRATERFVSLAARNGERSRPTITRKAPITMLMEATDFVESATR
jgi:hypothetical protein